MAGEKKRPIRIEIPEELGLSQNEIDSLRHVFRAQLAIVEAQGDVEATPIEAINTTRLAVEVEVIAPKRSPASKKSAKSPRQAP